MNEVDELEKKYERCWRCGMYFPREELQQWKGQWYCPYCLMEVQEEERWAEQRRKEITDQHKPPTDYHTPPPSPSASAQHDDAFYTCDRCGKRVDEIYITARGKFCSTCFHNLHLSQQPYVIYRRSPSLLKILLTIITSLYSILKNVVRKHVMAKRGHGTRRRGGKDR